MKSIQKLLVTNRPFGKLTARLALRVFPGGGKQGCFDDLTHRQ